MLTDELSFKIHTAADGVVWYASGINPAENSGQHISAFLNSPIISRVNLNVRLLGIPQNAELIVNLYNRKRKRELGTICVAGPNVCESMLELADPVLTFRRMRSTSFAVSCGGWHELTDAEFLIYSLIERRLKNNDWFDLFGRSLYETHPLYRALSFISNLSHKDTAELLTIIVDPRWYVDRRRPVNPCKLFLYLGLTPKTQKQVSDPESRKLRNGREYRCLAVLRCWKTSDPADVDFEAPSSFLWRIWRSAGGGPRGDLRASQAFIGYLQANWLDVFVRRRGLREDMFLPTAFFKTPSEQQSYFSHIKSE